MRKGKTNKGRDTMFDTFFCSKPGFFNLSYLFFSLAVLKRTGWDEVTNL